MPRVPLIIDARPRGPHGLLATEQIGGKPVLVQLVELARDAGGGDSDEPVSVHARIDEHETLASLFDEFERPRLHFVTGPPPEGLPILRSDRVYDPDRLKRVVIQGRDPEFAVVWRLDTPHSLVGVEDELIRRRTYQPLGRFWALEPARMLARKLVPTPVRPNMVTLTATFVFLSGTACVAWGGESIGWQIAAGWALALALILDTADGHLARLQGTASSFGRWLDSNLDELCDMALHAAIGWSCFLYDAWTGWLLLAMAYAMGKYLFMVGHEPEAESSIPAPMGLKGDSSKAQLSKAGSGEVHRLKQLVRLAGHADLRWHLWIALALVGRLELALIGYTLYFPIRALARGISKGVKLG